MDVLKPVKKVDLSGPGGDASSIGDGDAAAALVTFCATWESGAGFLADCAATLAYGLNQADGDYADTDEAIRQSVNSVRTLLS
jgi:hypothetical protein